MIEAVIFDMDGLLIDSEPLWHEAEIIAFEKVNIHLTRQDCLETTGMRVDEVVDYRYRRQPWEGAGKKEIAEDIIDNVIRLIQEKGELKDGAKQAIHFVQRLNVKVALASSSAYSVIRAVLDKFDLTPVFSVIHSAQEEPRGKPHPGVYLTACQKLNADPEACLAIEDSLAGVIAAKAAKMICIAVPEEAWRDDKRFVLADLQLTSLHELNDVAWEKISSL